MDEPITRLDDELLSGFEASDGRTLGAVLDAGLALLVFLRHLGCTFALEAGADLAAQRLAIEATGATLVLVHMTTPANAARFAARYGLVGVPMVADPQRRLYRAMGLGRGGVCQLIGPRVMVRGLEALRHGHTIGRLQGDGLQMPGVFLVRDRAVVRAFRHAHAGERPSYAALAQDVALVDGAV
jgi:hypothetical protein